MINMKVIWIKFNVFYYCHTNTIIEWRTMEVIPGHWLYYLAP